MQKLQNVPMIASPVAKIVLVPKIVPQLIQGLQDLPAKSSNSNRHDDL